MSLWAGSTPRSKHSGVRDRSSSTRSRCQGPRCTTSPDPAPPTPVRWATLSGVNNLRRLVGLKGAANVFPVALRALSLEMDQDMIAGAVVFQEPAGERLDAPDVVVGRLGTAAVFADLVDRFGDF